MEILQHEVVSLLLFGFVLNTVDISQFNFAIFLIVGYKSYWISQLLVFDDFFVIDIIECPATCETPPVGSCSDGMGTFMCMCNQGYTGDGQAQNCAGM